MLSKRAERANQIDIWTETFGDASDPAVLLITGESAQDVAWPDEMCNALVGGRRFVIRYDNLDTLRPTFVDPWASRPSLAAKTRDVARVLDAYRLFSAHLVGASTGRFIAQQATREFPHRVRSLTSIVSEPTRRGPCSTRHARSLSRLPHGRDAADPSETPKLVIHGTGEPVSEIARLILDHTR